MEIIAAKVDGNLVDLAGAPESAGKVTAQDPEALELLRHSAAHVMAEAVRVLFPGVKVAIGPSTDTGFYYDFDREEPFSEDDLARIERKMLEIVKARSPFKRRDLPVDEALRLFEEQAEPYKVELITDLKAKGETTVSLYTQGGFTDLCRGPHIPDTGCIKAVKLLSVAGAYWRGDEKNRMLQRIYGTAFFSDADLKAYLAWLEEAKERDHRKLGRELDLFSISDDVGAGLVIYHPKGAMLRYQLEEFERREHIRRGYDMIVGPQIMRTDLWKKSGHYDNYGENMYFTEVEGQGFGIKPMNCVAHIMYYKSDVRSYRDLPMRLFELGTVHRHERSGVLHGLLRVRSFTQDDAHIFCRQDQLEDEIRGVMDFIDDVMAMFGFEYEIAISTMPDKRIGSDEIWHKATDALKGALDHLGKTYVLNEGDGAFYGPKIDIRLKDALDRRWQCATIQCDFNLPERFDLSYVGQDNQRHRPVMLHRVILGSIDRFIGVLIEHYKGAFPLWIAPEQVCLITITDRQDAYVKALAAELRAADFRVVIDDRNEKLGFKLREASVRKYPCVAIIGDKDMEADAVTCRLRGEDEQKGVPRARFMEILKEKREQRR